jgi:type I restriction enzyme M protein
MPLTPDSRRIISQIRDHLWAGGYPDPMQNAEQLAFLFFFYLFEGTDEARVRAARRPGSEPYISAFAGAWTLKNPLNARQKGQETVPAEFLRWSSWANALNGDRLVTWVRDEVFPFYAAIAQNGTTNFMEGARLAIDEPTVLSQVVTRVNELRLETLDSDTKGDLFEHVLPDQASRRARPVPHAQAHHPRYRPDGRPADQRDSL